MDIRSKFPLVAVALLAVSLAACGSDSSPTGTPNDTTPPGVSNVTPVDANHIQVTFSEQVTKSSAENESNYSVVVAPVPVAPRGVAAARGGYLIAGATLKNDNKTVDLAVEPSMAGANLNLVVTGVSDMTGNKIGDSGVTKGFTGSNTTDTTAPTVLQHAPISDATNIATNVVIKVTFSETITDATVSLTEGANTIPTTFDIDGATLTATHAELLAFSTTYTVAVSGTDVANNVSDVATWTFTTQANNDHTPPTLVSTSPANLASNVDVNANLSVTFSEAINPETTNVQLVPDPGDGVATWSEDGKTVTFDPTAALLTNTQYTLTIFPNGVYDLAGNGIAGLHTVQFSTGSLAVGSIAGTITGDAGTPAADPTGATVIASDSNPFVGGSFSVFQSTKVAAADTYSLIYLPDGLYYIVSVMDTNHDGDLDPSTGDAVGAYGADIVGGDLNPDSLAVVGGAHLAGKNFTLYDPSTASGTVQYTGAVKGDYPIYVGLFDTNGFTTDDTPVASTQAFDVDNEWLFNSLEDGFTEDTVYVGAFMDVNLNGNYDPTIDPAGFYGGLPTPTTVNLSNGADRTGIVVHITDPVTSVSAPANAITWPKAKHNAAFQHLVEFVRQGQQQASR